MKKLNKKAFTIVELVIVIAVIAILAGVLIPTFIGLVRKSRVSTDTQLVRNLNIALAEDGVKNEHNTMTDVLAVAEDYGYVVANLNAKAKDNEILWDSANDVFCYLNDGKVEYLPDSVKDGKKLESGDYRLWKIYNKAPADGDGYSIYVASQAAADYVASNEVAVGVDCGEYLIDAVSYKNTGAAQNDVVIRTNSASTTLTINAALDTVKHYGSVGSLNIIAVANASYHEYGKAAFAEIATGRIVLESESEVEHIHLTATEGNFNDITVAKASDVEMPDFSRDPVEIPAAGKLIVALQDGTAQETEKDFVWLTAVGIYEQVTVSASGSSAGTTYAAQIGSDEQKVAAQQIANNITFSDGGKDYKVTATKVGDDWTYEVKTVADEETTYTASIENNEVVVKDSGNENVETTKENGLSESEKTAVKTEVVNEAKVDEAVNRKTSEANLDKACLNAITNVYYDSLSEAFNAVQNNETLIVLKDDYTLDVADLSAAQTLINKKFTLNLNGKKLVSNGSRFEIGQNSELTINGNGAIEIRGIGKNDSGILVSNNSTLNFENGSLFVENNQGGYNKTYGIFGSNNSTINIGKTGTNGPTIEAGVALTTNGNAQFEGCTFNVYSGTLIGNRAQGDGDSNVVQLANTAGINTINIYGGKFIQNATPADGLNTIFELRYAGTKNINIYGGEFVCGQYMFRFNASAHRSNVFINDQTGMDYEIYYKCADCAAGTH